MPGKANRATALFADATRSVALFAFPGNLPIGPGVLGDLEKSMPGFSKANFGSYGPSI